MREELHQLDSVFEEHTNAGALLFGTCGGEIFPCDALAFAVLDRSFGLVKGFRVLVENGGYSSAMALLRMQLDNLLRLRGVLASGDAHDIANQMFNGKHLRSLKDRSGEKMTDRHLLDGLKPSAPWIEDVYDFCSGYVHLSAQHIHYFLARCQCLPDGKREFAIGDDDEHVPEEGKVRLVKAFVVTTRVVPKLVRVWCEVRESHGSNDQLKTRFHKDV